MAGDSPIIIHDSGVKKGAEDVAPPIETVPACHRSWLTPTRIEQKVNALPGGKMQTMIVPMNVGTMFPCFGAACMLWDAEHGMCLDRSTPFLAAGRKPVKPVLPVIEPAKK